MVVTRAPGVVYTPREVCEPMVRRALEPLLAKGDPRQLRVCDPAAGEGAFLVEVVRMLSEHAPAREIAARCIYGADIDAPAIETARANIERLVGAPVPELKAHLRVGDALALRWPTFDAVVANPPYIRQERLSNKTALRAYQTYDGVADLYVYFVELAHRLLRRGGRYCLITPNKWLTAAYGRPLREFLAREKSVEGLVDFSRTLPLFDADAFPCILWGTRGARTTPRAARASAETVAEALAEPGTPHARWRAEPWHVDTQRDAALLDHLARRFPPLRDLVADPSRGIITGCNRAFVIDSATRGRLLDADPETATLIRPLIKGRDVRRWQPAQIDRFVLLIDRGTRLPRAIRTHLQRFRAALEPGSGRKPGRYKWYELQDSVVPLAKSRAPRLFYQDIQTQPACCLDPSGALVPDTTVWILPSHDPFLLALLNSRFYRWYAERRFPPALNGAVRPKLDYMRKLPVAPGNDRIAQLVTAQLSMPTAANDRTLDELIADAYELDARDRQVVFGS